LQVTIPTQMGRFAIELIYRFQRPHKNMTRER